MRTITFYSYKGGTGRTLLAANMAVLAAKLGKKVVALDFDLEAPGLPYKFPEEARTEVGGLIEWLVDALAGTAPEDTAGHMLDIAVGDPFVPGGWLKLMPAGRMPGLEYFHQLRHLHLEQRLDDGPGIDALLELQQRIEKDLEADYLLLDARTGITTTNAVTTHVLADEIVVLTIDTAEQLDGTRAVLRDLQPLTSIRTDKPLELHTVLSRVPPRPRDAGLYARTEDEDQRIARVLAFLNEPAERLEQTLDLDHLHLLHTDLALTREEFLSLLHPGPRTRSVLHVDYWYIAKALFGQAVEAQASKVLERARDDSERLEELAHYFVAPDVLTEARGRKAKPAAIYEASEPGLEQQVEILRRQASRDPSVRPNLAATLTAVSESLARLGRRNDAIKATKEAVILYEDLARTSVEFVPDLLDSFVALSIYVAEAGRREEALALSGRVVEGYRNLTDASPDRFLQKLLGALSNFAADASTMGHYDEALAAIEEAVERSHDLRHAHPALIASLLNNRSNSLAALGRHDEALAAIEAALDDSKKLAARNKDSSPDLASMLGTRSIRLMEVGRQREALGASEECVNIWRHLSEETPERFLPDLASSLNNHAGILAKLGRHDEALAAIDEARDAYGRLAGTLPDAARPGLAASLANKAGMLLALGRHEDALRANEDALGITRELAAAEPEAFAPRLAMTLNNRSNTLSAMERYEEALAISDEALALWRHLAEGRPDAHLPGLALTLNNRSRPLGELERHSEALAAIDEAVGLYRHLVKGQPEAHLADLAMALHNRSLNLTALGRHDEALASIDEAVAIRRQLAESVPDVHLPSLAHSLEQRAQILDVLGREAEAADARAEVEDIGRRLLDRRS